MEEQKNLFLFITIAVAIYLGFLVFVQPYFTPPKPPVPPQMTQTAQNAPGTPTPAPTATPGNAPSGPGGAPATPASTLISRDEALHASPRIAINTPKLHGTIALAGASLDDLSLATYHETIDPKSPEIELLSPTGTEHAYVINFGWQPSPGKSVPLPNESTLWTPSSQDPLTPAHAVELSWDNGQGLIFKRKISIDDNYLFTVTQSVTNNGTESVSLYPYGRISRAWQAPASSTYLLHEGPVAVLGGKLHDGGVCFLRIILCDDYNYADIKKLHSVEDTTTGGWLGFTDKYWLTALIPAQSSEVRTKVWSLESQQERYQVDYIGVGAIDIPPGGSASTTSHAFAGAKEVDLLDHYEKEPGIPSFDRAIDFGLFYWITKPIFLFLNYLYGIIGNFGLSIMLLTLTIKLVFFPLANRSYRAMSKMKLLQPEIAKLREKFGDDKAKLNQEVMALYKRVGANPMAGCLPIFVQIPVFFSLYKVLYVTIEMRHAPFYGWIHDLSAPDPTTWLNLFGLIPWDPTHYAPAILMLGAWPLMMGVTMFLQQKLNPAPADPVQAKMMMALPLVFTFMLGQFPAGLVIYWSWNNLLSIAQQWVIMHRAGAA